MRLRLERLKGLWGGLKPMQRFAVVGGVVTLIGVVLVASLWTQTPDYATLFSGLSEQDAADVVEQLKALEIPYRLAQGGAVIQVPERQVYDTRLELATQGLPKGGTVGFELFDTSQLGNLGMSDFMQRVNYQRALEGELERTVASLEPVASARVHIVIPEQSLFTDEQREPTASVVLQLKPHAELTREQVQAIDHLVAASVEGLKASNITLVDTAGSVLSAAGQGSDVPANLQNSAGQLQTQRDYERDQETRLQAMLDQALGPGHAIVRVNATFNWDEKQVSSETYAAPSDGSGVIRSEQIDEEASGDDAAAAGGVPGVTSNTQQIPGYPTIGTAVTSTLYTKRSTTRNYEVSKVVQTVTHAPGSLQRVTVGVLLDDQLDATVAASIQPMLATASGLDTSRGDSVVVQQIAFSGQTAGGGTAAATLAERNQQLYSLARLGILVLVLLVVMLFARSIFRDLSRRLSGERVPYMQIIEQGSDFRLSAPEVAAQLPERSLATAKERVQPEVFPEIPEDQDNPMRRHLMDLSARRPDLIADLVQTWLAES